MGNAGKAPLWQALLLGGLLIAGGAAATFLLGLPILEKARASTNWPQAPGTIISSNLAEKREKGKTNYWVDVRYSYEVDGTVYEGDTVWFGEYRTTDRAAMDTIVKKYPINKTVQVFFNPADKAECVLDPGTTWSSYFVLVLGCLLMFAGVLVSGGTLVSRLLFRGSTG